VNDNMLVSYFCFQYLGYGFKLYLIYIMFLCDEAYFYKSSINSGIHFAYAIAQGLCFCDW